MKKRKCPSLVSLAMDKIMEQEDKIFMENIKPHKLKLVHNKKIFGHAGVLFEINKDAGVYSIQRYHWPNCGMSAKTARHLSKWLLKAADELDKKPKGEVLK